MEAAPGPLEASRGDDDRGLAPSACRAGSPYALAHARTLMELFAALRRLWPVRCNLLSRSMEAAPDPFEASRGDDDLGPAYRGLSLSLSPSLHPSSTLIVCPHFTGRPFTDDTCSRATHSGLRADPRHEHPARATRAHGQHPVRDEISFSRPKSRLPRVLHFWAPPLCNFVLFGRGDAVSMVNNNAPYFGHDGEIFPPKMAKKWPRRRVCHSRCRDGHRHLTLNVPANC